ncbi:MAG TPA: ATP-binding protein [Planctomycetota bacterium]|nr:ATP-binding protein [Planctomycetota bacterium]
MSVDPPTAAAPRVSAYASDTQLFALLIDSVREYAIYMLDANGVVRTWNAGGRRIKGYESSEIIGKHVSQMFAREDRDAMKPQRLLDRAAREGSVRDEGWRVRKDGTKFWASVLITAIRDGSGKLTGFAKVSRDETERHAVEEQVRRHADDLEVAVQERTRELEERTRQLLVQAEELKRSNEELEQFNYITSHDLQEPIRMVGMYIQKLIEQGDALTAEQKGRYMRYALEGAERMRELIDELLRYSRIDRDASGLSAIDTGAAVQAALDNLVQVIADRQVEVTTGPMPMVRANQAQLIQVFQNLIENAIKYGPKQDPRIAISSGAFAEDVRFSVTDNGIGIDPAHHQKIFAVFQRLHDRSEYPGTGMGLAICKKIIERMGGRIWVESSPGDGSTFHFTLPRASA